jgi:ABC-type multidrug transport system permease subunit
MRGILNIAFTQIRLQLSERGAILMLFIVPIIMMVFIGAATGGFNSQTGTLDVVRTVDPVDPADPVVEKFISLLRANGKEQVAGKDKFVVCDLAKPAEQPEACKLTDFKAGDDALAFAKMRVGDSATSAAINLPANLAADLQAGKKVLVQLITKGDPTTLQTVQQYVDAVNTRLSGAVLAAQVVKDKAQGDSALYDKIYAGATALWDKDPVQVIQTFSTVTGTAVGTGFGQSAPGIALMFVMITALTLAEVFIIERRQGSLQRLMVMPLTRAQILAGKMLGQYLLCLLTFIVMIAAGVALGVNWGDPVGVTLIVLVYTLAVTTMGLALATLVRTGGQASGARLLLSLVLAPLGGAWWPINFTPETMQIIGKIVSPIAWAQDAFSKLIFYGATLGDVLPSVAVLLIFSAVFFVFGITRFRYE